MKNSTTGFRSSSGFFPCLFAELDRDRILIFFVSFSLYGVIVGAVKLFGEAGGFNDKESERGLLCITIGGKLGVSSNVFCVGEEGTISLNQSIVV
jgi:hypothetical protein